MRYILLLILLTGCSKEFHLNKYYKKGGQIECVPEVINRTDTIKGKDGRDSVIYCTDTVYKPNYIYIPKWKVKIEYRRFKDSLRNERIIYRDKLKTVVKLEKKPWYNVLLFVFGFTIGAILSWVIKNKD